MIDPLELHALADGQLNESDARRVSDQLKSDEHAKSAYDSIISLKQALCRCEPCECQIEWRRCVARLDELDKTKKVDVFVARNAWKLCGVFLLFIIAGGVANRLIPSRGMEASDVARVAAALSPTSNPRSQEPREVQQFLDRLVGQAAQSIASDHIQILNGATGELDGHRVAKLGLRDDSGDLCLIVINGELNLAGMPNATDPRFHEAKFQGMNSVAWTENGTTMILSGDRSCDSLIDTVLHKVIR